MCRQEQQHSADIAAFLSEDNHFEWNPRIECDNDTFKKILSKHNKTFKNNEPVNQYKTSDFIVKNAIFTNVDTTQRLNTPCLGRDHKTQHPLAMIISPITEGPFFSEEVENFTLCSPEVLTLNGPEMPIQNYEELNSFAMNEQDDTHECHAVFTEDTVEEVPEEFIYEVPVPKNENPKNKSLTPISIMVVDTVGLVKSRKLLKVLFDPGSTKTLIKKSAIPAAATPIPIQEKRKINTIAGSMCSEELIRLNGLRLPEFDKNRQIEGIKALIFDSKCKYDIILGADFLNMIGLDIKYSTGEMEWYGNTLPMQEPWDIENKKICTW